MQRQFIPRSLDLTEKQLIELIRKAIEGKIFSEEFINLLREELNKE
ncbi:sporulation histidine kinase inhibitor Sda [uncultured Clostridium sp.]|nr:sporulation histidine kinase inhibitor Sda [uncultured Clostridium sp.]